MIYCDCLCCFLPKNKGPGIDSFHVHQFQEVWHSCLRNCWPLVCGFASGLGIAIIFQYFHVMALHCPGFTHNPSALVISDDSWVALPFPRY